MTHEGTVELIGDLMQGRLSGAVRDEVLAHVRECAECRALSEACTVLSAAFDETDEPHPPSELIVRYALGEAGLGERERDWVASHVLSCSPCASDLEAVGEAEAELAHAAAPEAGSGTALRARAVRWAPAIAAGVVAGLLAYPAYLGLFGVSRIEERIALLEERKAVPDAAAAWDGGPVHQRLLSSPLRGAGDALVAIPVAEGQPYVTLNVDPGSLEEYATGVTRFSVLDGTGSTVWSRDLTADQVRGYARETGTLEFIVPAAVLPEGPLTLSILRGAEHVLEARFVIEPQHRL